VPHAVRALLNTHHHGKKIVSSINGAGKIGQLYTEE